MKAKLIRDMAVLPKRVKEGHPPIMLAGTIIDHPKAYRLCQQGVAVPEDKECMDATRISDSVMEEKIIAYDLADKGIARDDFSAFNRGLMVGYKPDGTTGDTWKPGPSWTEGCEVDYYEDQQEVDDE